MRLLRFSWFFAIPFLFSYSLQEECAKAEEGDYLVMEANKMVTLLSIHSITPTSLVLEEISAPSKNLTMPISWKDWVMNKAPGHTSWSMVEIDRNQGTLLECYSFSRACWIRMTPQESLFATLYTLPLTKIEETTRRRIGPPPHPGELDTRRIWIPPTLFEGEKKISMQCDAYQSEWPRDESSLSGDAILLYFARDWHFPLPIWIEVAGSHFHLSFRALDAGKQLCSPHTTFPRRTIEFIGQPRKSPHGLRLFLKTPSYHRNFALFAIDQTDLVKEVSPLSYSILREEDELLDIEISEETLQQTLTPGHRYSWFVLPQEHPAFAKTSKPYLYSST